MTDTLTTEPSLRGGEPTWRVRVLDVILDADEPYWGSMDPSVDERG